MAHTIGPKTAKNVDNHSTALKRNIRRSACGRERETFYYIIVQTYDVGLHSRRHPIVSESVETLVSESVECEEG